MSRGFGRLQRSLMAIIRHHGRPMTFAEIRGERRHPTRERSVRRALRSLVDDYMLIAIGDGGRREPTRYFIHPLIIRKAGDKDLWQAFEGDPGAEEAVDKMTASMARETRGASEPL